MIFVDKNVPMYPVRTHHPINALAIKLVETPICGRERFVTTLEVFRGA